MSLPLDRREREVRSAELLLELEAFKFSTRHDNEFRNGVAIELNTILDRTRRMLEAPADESDLEFAEAVLSVVQRVAEFEEIELKEGPR